jgi:hypothetical protein
VAGSKSLTYEIGIDAGDAVGSLKTFSNAVKSAMRDVESELDDGATAGEKLAAALDQIGSRTKEEFASAATAAEEMGRALKAAGSSLDVADVLPQLQRLGLSFDEVTQDADKLAVALKDLDDVKATGLKDLDATAPGLASKLDDVNKSADSSRNALANMVGNSVQDVTGLGGALGVALGQLAEFGTDAKLAGEGLGSVFKGLAGVAAPIAGLALATQALGAVTSRFGDSQKRTTASVEAWENALDSSGSATENYADSLRDLGKVTLDVTRSQSGLANVTAELDSNWYSTGAGVHFLTQLLGASNDETKDLTKTLNQAGVSVDRWAELAAGGADEAERFATFLESTNLSADEQKDILTGLSQAQEDHAKASKNDAAANKFFGESSEEKTARLEEEKRALEEASKAEDEATQAAKEHAIALSEANGELADITSTFAEIGRRGDAISAVFDLGNAPLDAASATRDITEAIGGLKEAAKGVKVGDILAGNMKGDAVLDALDGLRPQIQAKVAEAFSAGGPEAATAVADDYVNQIVASLGGKLTADQVKELLGLSDLEATVAVALDMSTAARVRQQLAVLTGISGETPLTASIALALDAGTISPEAAEVLVRAQLGQAKVTLPTDVTPPTPEQIAEAGAFVSANAEPATLPTALDTKGATSDLHGFTGDVKDTKAVVPLDADDTKAEAERKAFESKTNATTPSVKVSADTLAAINTMLYLKILSALLAPQVTVTADTGPAQRAIAGIRGTSVPVEAYLADYPTAAEIQARIGRPKIPVDIIVGQSIRITGVRE